MAANGSVGKWEVVKKSKKQSSGRGQTDRKHTAPIKMSETIYEGLEKISKKQNKEQPPPAPEPKNRTSNPSNASQQQPQKKKLPANGSGQKAGGYRSVEEAVKALDVADLQRQLDKSQSLFPENPSVWLKDLAGYLNYKLQAPDLEPTLSVQTHDYPLCLATKELKGIMKSLLGKNDDALQDFFDHCLFSMLRELDKPSGDSLHGYRMCVQVILQDRPHIATLSLPDHLELLRSQQNRPAKCLTIMWALGQAGFTDLAHGLQVWLAVMLPVLGTKALSSFAISYLERLLSIHANLTKGFGIMGPKEFFPLLDFAYMPRNALSSGLQEQLKNLYPRLKVLAFGAKPESTLHTYFPSFLSRATPHCPEHMKRELLSSMTECLTLDSHTLSVWQQLYPKHLSQSSLLLNSLLKSWNNLPPKLCKNLQETIQSFKVTNEEVRGLTASSDVKECISLCSTLQQKMKSGGFPWLRLFLTVLVFSGGFLIHDLRSHGSFYASRSARFLQDSGLMSVWDKAAEYGQQGLSWLQISAPLCYSWLVSMATPLLQNVWDGTQTCFSVLIGYVVDVSMWLQENGPRLVDWLQASVPDSVFQLLLQLRDFLLFIHQSVLLPAAVCARDTLARVGQALLDSCEGEVSVSCLRRHLLSLSNTTWMYLQEATAAVKNWATGLVSTG